MELYTQLFVHLVWATRGRAPVLTPEVLTAIVPYLTRREDARDLQMLLVDDWERVDLEWARGNPPGYDDDPR